MWEAIIATKLIAANLIANFKMLYYINATFLKFILYSFKYKTLMRFFYLPQFQKYVISILGKHLWNTLHSGLWMQMSMKYREKHLPRVLNFCNFHSWKQLNIYNNWKDEMRSRNSKSEFIYVNFYLRCEHSEQVSRN